MPAKRKTNMIPFDTYQGVNNNNISIGKLRVKIHNAKSIETIIVEADTKEEFDKIANEELYSRGWYHGLCWVEILNSEEM